MNETKRRRNEENAATRTRDEVEGQEERAFFFETKKESPYIIPNNAPTMMDVSIGLDFFNTFKLPVLANN